MQLSAMNDQLDLKEKTKFSYKLGTKLPLPSDFI